MSGPNDDAIGQSDDSVMAVIGDEDTVTGFLLGGVGHHFDIRKTKNYLVVDSKVTVKVIEDTLKEFTSRNDVAILLISQYVADLIRPVVNRYGKPVPAILEIPSKDHPYDPAKDSILQRVAHMM